MSTRFFFLRLIARVFGVGACVCGMKSIVRLVYEQSRHFFCMCVCSIRRFFFIIIFLSCFPLFRVWRVSNWNWWISRILYEFYGIDWLGGKTENQSCCSLKKCLRIGWRERKKIQKIFWIAIEFFFLSLYLSRCWCCSVVFWGYYLSRSSRIVS